MTESKGFEPLFSNIIRSFEIEILCTFSVNLIHVESKSGQNSSFDISGVYRLLLDWEAYFDKKCQKEKKIA